MAGMREEAKPGLSKPWSIALSAVSGQPVEVELTGGPPLAEKQGGGFHVQLPLDGDELRVLVANHEVGHVLWSPYGADYQQALPRNAGLLVNALEDAAVDARATLKFRWDLWGWTQKKLEEMQPQVPQMADDAALVYALSCAAYGRALPDTLPERVRGAVAPFQGKITESIVSGTWKERLQVVELVLAAYGWLRERERQQEDQGKADGPGEGREASGLPTGIGVSLEEAGQQPEGQGGTEEEEAQLSPLSKPTAGGKEQERSRNLPTELPAFSREEIAELERLAEAAALQSQALVEHEARRQAQKRARQQRRERQLEDEKRLDEAPHPVRVVRERVVPWTPPTKLSRYLRQLPDWTEIGPRRGHVGSPTPEAWRLNFGEARVFARPSPLKGDVVIALDWSGSISHWDNEELALAAATAIARGAGGRVHMFAFFDDDYAGPTVVPFVPGTRPWCPPDGYTPVCTALMYTERLVRREGTWAVFITDGAPHAGVRGLSQAHLEAHTAQLSRALLRRGVRYATVLIGPCVEDYFPSEVCTRLEREDDIPKLAPVLARLARDV
mgnify:CR=1 FL=1